MKNMCDPKIHNRGKQIFVQLMTFRQSEKIYKKNVIERKSRIDGILLKQISDSLYSLKIKHIHTHFTCQIYKPYADLYDQKDNVFYIDTEYRIYALFNKKYKAIELIYV